MANDEIEIIIDDVDDALKDDKSPPVEKATPVAVDTGIDILKSQLSQSEAARVEAERRAVLAQGEVADSQLALVSSAMETAKQNSAIFRQNYAAAMQAGDFEAAAQIQEDIAINAQRLSQLEEGKRALETAPRAQPPAPRSMDPVEDVARTLSPRSAAWVRAHPEYASDQKMLNRMIAAHNLAVTHDLVPDSDDYFRHVEGTLGISNTPPPATRREAPPPAAPSSRQASSSGSNRPSNSVTLSSAEREIAAAMGMSEKEYAKNKLALQRDGKL